MSSRIPVTILGATGTVAFDEFGDPVRRLVTVYERRIGTFRPARLLAVEP